MSTLNFHVRHEVTPERVWAVLEAIADGYNYDHVTQSSRQLNRLRQLGLVTDGGEQMLTSHGQQVYDFGIQKPEVLPEIWHYLHYTRWQGEQPLESTMFYTYRAYNDLLYARGQATLDSDARETYTAELNGMISAVPEFEGFESDLKKGALSLSPNSLRGVEHWLHNLSPGVVRDGQFERRHFCVAEILVLALGFVTEHSAEELGIEQMLTPEKRARICQLCQLDDSGFDQTLDWALPAFPKVAEAGTTSGSYGRFVRMLKIPTLEDLLA